MAKKKEQQKTNSIMGWLEGILSTIKKNKNISIFGSLLVLISTGIGCLEYYDSLPAKVTLEYTSSWLGRIEYSKPVKKNITKFVSLKTPSGNSAHWGNGGLCGLVSIHNKCKKSVTNLKVTVEIVYDNLHLNLVDIDPDYEILRCDSVYNAIKSITLRYKDDVLSAQSILPFPIHALYLSEGDTIDGDKCVGFHYEIRYDGLKEPLVFEEYNQIYFADNYDDEEPPISRYLDDCYYKYHSFTDQRANSLVTIPTMNEVIYVNPPTLSSDEDYKKFKNDFLKKFSDSTSNIITIN